MTKQLELLGEVPVMGPSSEDREAWLHIREQGITATEVATLAKGYRTDWRRILTEKVTGARADLSGNKFVQRGVEREPVITAWIDLNYGIPANSNVYSINEGRYLATPDGMDWGLDSGGIRTCAEVKTSKHNLDPGIDDGHFYTSGYYDQMQWQMFVMGADSTLFVWEQHDDKWPNPTPIFEEPQARWISRDIDRIDYLIDLADRFLLELDAARTSGLPPVSEMDPWIADLVHELLQARDAEAVAKARKDMAWKDLLNQVMPEEGEYHAENDEAKVTVSATTKTVTEVDEVAMREQEPEFMAAFDQMQAFYSRKADHYTTTREETMTKLTVTAKRH